MKKYDFFDITGLPFDPPEKAVRKIMTTGDLLNREIADGCIKIIAKYFPDKAVATAIYNYEAGLREIPYL